MITRKFTGVNCRTPVKLTGGQVNTVVLCGGYTLACTQLLWAAVATKNNRDLKM